MKKLLFAISLIGLFLGGSYVVLNNSEIKVVKQSSGPTLGLSTFQVVQGGTGATTLTGCLEGNGTSAITGTGSACGGGGDPFTHPLLGLSATTSQMLFGTSTAGNFGVTIATSTAPQLSLSAGSGIAQWVMRNAGGNLYLATTTVAGSATSTPSAFTILGASGFVGIGTDAPTHPLTLPSGSTGMAIYNTADQTTNYERFRIFFSANLLSLRGEKGGSGTNRDISIGTVSRTFEIDDNGSEGSFYRYSNITGTSVDAVGIATTRSNSSGTPNEFEILPILNQTGTAGYTALLINTTENTVGSGERNLIDAQVGGTSRFVVKSAGNVGIASTTPWGLLSVNPNALGSGVPEFVIGSSSATRLVVTGGGRVGIGTASPSTAFQIFGTSPGGNFRFQTDGGSAGEMAMYYLNESVPRLTIGRDVPNSGEMGIIMKATSGGTIANGGAGFGSNALGRLTFYTSNGTALTDQGGINFGQWMMGTTTNTGRGQVTIASTTGPQLSLSASTGIAQWTFRNAGGNLYIGTTTVDGLATSSVSSFTLTSTGRLGLGPQAGSEPNALLHLKSNSLANGTQATQLRIQNTGGFTGGGMDIGFTSTNSVASGDQARIGASRTNRAVSGDTDLWFFTQSNSAVAERMRIRDDGNVGIGTSTPTTLLSVAGLLTLKQGLSTSTVQAGGVMFATSTDASNNTTIETDIFTETIKSNTLGVNNDSVEAKYTGTFVGSGTATRQVRAYFGGTLCFDTGAVTITTNSAWVLSVDVQRVSSTVVRCSATLNTQGASLSAYTGYTEITGLSLAADNILKVTGTAAGAGAASADIVAKIGKIKWFPSN